LRVPSDRSGLRSYLILIALLASEMTARSILHGAALIALGIAMHVWAKGCLHQNQEVTRSGPYRFVRHPFYLANALLDAGIAVMSGWWVLQMVLPVWWSAVYLPVIRREERTMTEHFGAAYEAYQREVPQLIPHRMPAPAPASGFSWRNPNLVRTELPRVLRYLAYPLVFYLVGRLWAERAYFFTTPSWLEAFALFGCVGLYVASVVIRRMRTPLAPLASST
jgi:hypothetical protein